MLTILSKGKNEFKSVYLNRIVIIIVIATSQLTDIIIILIISDFKYLKV